MTTEPLVFAARHSPDRRVLMGALGLRTARYRSEGVVDDTGALVHQRVLAGIPDLSITVVGQPERPLYHEQSGIYGFLRLAHRAAAYRLEIQDPAGRYLPKVVQHTVADRTHERERLEAGHPIAAPDVGEVIKPLLMRPALSVPLEGAITAVWGRVVDTDGQPVPLARLRIATRVAGQDTAFVAFSDLRGDYLAPLTGERAEYDLPDDDAAESDPLAPPTDDGDDAGSIQLGFTRALESVHVLSADILRDLRGRLARDEQPLRALPVGFDEVDPAAAGSPFTAHAAFQLQPHPSGPPAGEFTIQIGQRVRWDVHLT